MNHRHVVTSPLCNLMQAFTSCSLHAGVTARKRDTVVDEKPQEHPESLQATDTWMELMHLYSWK